MSTLLKIGSDVQALADLLDKADAELSADEEAALEQWFAELQQNQRAKLDGYGSLIRELELRVAVRKEEAERLQKRAKTGAALADRLKERLHLFLHLTKQMKVETDRYTFSVVANGGSEPLDITVPVEELPDAYTVVERKADKRKIAEALKAGTRIAGCTLLPRGTRLSIR